MGALSRKKVKVFDSTAVRLPAQPTLLIGRRREVASLRRRLVRGSERLLTLVGPPGVGKTRLALAAASAAARSYEDVSFVDLAPLEHQDLIPPAIGQALAARTAGGASWESTITTGLSARRVLLLLDNFEYFPDAAPLLARLLTACPCLQLLVTSRTPLRLRWETLVSVAPLALPAEGEPWQQIAERGAVRLFVDRVRATLPNFNVTVDNAVAVARVCVLLDGLPLAIELAAAPGAALSPHRLADRLEQDLDLLSDGAHDLPARQRSLRAALGWSYRRLAPAQQTAFRRFAVFPGSASAEAARAVCALVDEGSDSELALRGLAEANLLRWVEDNLGMRRYVMLETVRAYAREQLEATGEAADARRGHAAYFLDQAERAACDFGALSEALALAQLAREDHNLRAAVAWLADHGPLESGLRLGAALWRFWVQRGEPAEACQMLARFVAQEGPPSAARTACLLGIANLAYEQGDYETACRRFEESLAMAQAAGDADGVARAHSGLAFVRQQRGDYAAARRHLQQSLALAREYGFLATVASSVHALGFVTHQEGDTESSLALLEESLVVRRRLGQPLGVARVLASLGLVYLRQGAFDVARRYYDESLRLRRQLGERRGIAHTLVGLAHVATGQRRFAEAAALLSESAALVAKLEDRHGGILLLEARAALAAERGHHADAVTFLTLAASRRSTLGVPAAPSMQAALCRIEVAARAALGPDAFAVAVATTDVPTVDHVLRAAGGIDPAGEHACTAPGATAATLPPVILSRREWQVARLVTRGATNAEIAEALVVAEGTVANHVHRILAKAGFRSRAQLAAWVGATATEAADQGA